jgi:hypothetical protein
MWPERPAGLRYGGPREVGHHLHDLGHQWGGSVCFNIRLTNAAEVQRGIVGKQAAWTCRMVMSMPHAALNMKHGNGHAACTWTCSMDMDMQHGHGHSHGHGHAAWTRTSSMDIDMQHGHWHGAWAVTWTGRMDMDMQPGHGHAYAAGWAS